jgi:serine/threonine protein kinase
MRYFAYERLKVLQGTVIPTLFGQGPFNGRPALVLSEVDGITLRELARTDVQEKTLETQLEKAIQAIHEKGAEYGDLNLGNFLFCKNGEVVIVDLEEVEFPDKRQPWERSVNLGGMGYLMSRFRFVRNPNRAPTPPTSWGIRSDDSDDKSALESAGPAVVCS